MSPLAETWECSTHPDGVSTVCCGTFDKMELTAVIKAHPEYLGERHKGETTLPILVKLIDARKDLSVQVHPDDDYAKMKEHGQLGKTEMEECIKKIDRYKRKAHIAIEMFGRSMDVEIGLEIISKIK